MIIIYVNGQKILPTPNPFNVSAYIKEIQSKVYVGHIKSFKYYSSSRKWANGVLIGLV